MTTTETPAPFSKLSCDTCGEMPVPVVAAGRFALWCPCCEEAGRERAVYVKPESRLPTEWRALDPPESAAEQRCQTEMGVEPFEIEKEVEVPHDD